MTNTKNKDMDQFYCSILVAEVKKRIQILKEYGMSESEIVSHINSEQPALKKLIISRNYRILIGDECKDVHMEPLVKSVYLLFLKHPEGINFKDLPDYRQELADIYNKVRPLGLTDRAFQSIEDVTNPMLNSINEKCARIRRAFVSVLDKSIADHYIIKGPRGEAKKIALPRELVTWE